MTIVESGRVSLGEVVHDFSTLAGKVGILQSTFDPGHIGVRDMALAAMERHGLDKIVLVPSMCNPLEVGAPLAEPRDRVELLRRLVAGDPRFIICDSEMHDGATRFTADLMQKVVEQAQPGTELYLLLGEKSAQSLHQWRRVEEMAEAVRLVFVTGHDRALDTVREHLPDGVVTRIEADRVQHARLDVSAPGLRRAIAEGEPTIGALTELQRAYIDEQGLYRDSSRQKIGILSGEVLHGPAREQLSLITGGKRVSDLSEGVVKQLEQQQSFRVAVAQIETRPGDLEFNFAQILKAIDRAEAAEVAAVVLPELATAGYCSMDLFKSPQYLAANRSMVEKICEYTVGKKVTVVLGAPYEDQDQGDGTRPVRNAALVIHDGRVEDVVKKINLPDYDIFFEPREFKAGDETHVVTIAGRKIGVHICEDLFDATYPRKVCEELRRAGAEFYFNLSGSPYNRGKFEYRTELISGKAQQLDGAFLYCNTFGEQDGYDGRVLFDGRSMVFDRSGALCKVGKFCEEDFFVVDLAQPVPIAVPEWTAADEMHDAIVMGIRKYCEKNGVKTLLIGLSGGVDSALVAALCVEAVGPDRVKGITMPSHLTSKETYQDALDLAKNLGIECEIRPIRSLYRAWEHEELGAQLGSLGRIKYYAQRMLSRWGLASPPKEVIAPIAKQNAQSRLRGFTLMEKGNLEPGTFIVNTGNHTEAGNNYWTLYGDGIGAFGPIGDLDKAEEIYAVGRVCNQRFGREVIPESTLSRPPTAELEPGQTDEGNLGAQYGVLGPLTRDLAERHISVRELKQRGVDSKVVDDVWRRLSQSEWKRRQLPPSFRLHTDTFGLGRRIPDTMRWKGDNPFSDAAAAPEGVPVRDRKAATK